jgi:ribosomal protein S27E
MDELGQTPDPMRMSIPLTSNACLAHYRGGFAVVTCTACRHERDIRVETLARRLGWDANLARALRRFRCSQCGARTVELAFAYEYKPRGRMKNPS